MARKRERIYPRQLKSGETVWDVSLDYRDVDTGKRVQKMRTFRTLAEAKTCLAEHRADTAHGAASVPHGMTVAGAMREWLASHQPHLKPTTYERYRSIVDLHILPHLGAIELRQLTTRRVEQHYARLRREGVGPFAVQSTHWRLVQALTWARRNHLVSTNVAQDATLPPAVSREMCIWSDAEIAAFSRVAGDSRYGPIWHIALLTGLRRGELLGLRWQDIDEVRGIVNVCENRTRLLGRLIVQTPKSGKTRRIAVPDELLAPLRQHRAHQKEIALRMGRSWSEADPIFTCSRYTPIDPTQLRADLNRLADRAGVPRLRIHDLRHTHASWLLRHGKSVREVSERLGHTRTSMTLDVYAHVLPDEHRATADLIGRALATG